MFKFTPIRIKMINNQFYTLAADLMILSVPDLEELIEGFTTELLVTLIQYS